MTLDLKNKTGKIEYFNFQSGVKKEERYWANNTEKKVFLNSLEKEREKDFEEIIKEFKDVYPDKNKSNIEKTLYKDKKKLNSTESFNYEKLAPLDIYITSDSLHYFMKIKKEDKLISSNGTCKEENGEKVIYWDINQSTIYITIQPFSYIVEKLDYIESMLPYWKAWKKN